MSTSMALSPSRVGLIAVGLSMILTTSVDAQRRPEAFRQDRNELEQRVRARMGQVMQERLGLDASEREALSEIVRSFEQQRRELAAREQATQRRVEAVLLEGAEDESEAAELLERMARLRAEEAELFRSEQARLLEVLDPSQVLSFHVFRARMGERIRALRGRAEDSTGRPGQGGRPSRGPRRGPGG